MSSGLDASQMIKTVVAPVQGSGGGRAEFAQAGGKDASKIKEALEVAWKLAEEKIRGVK